MNWVRLKPWGFAAKKQWLLNNWGKRIWKQYNYFSTTRSSRHARSPRSIFKERWAKFDLKRAKMKQNAFPHNVLYLVFIKKVVFWGKNALLNYWQCPDNFKNISLSSVIKRCNDRGDGKHKYALSCYCFCCSLLYYELVFNYVRLIRDCELNSSITLPPSAPDQLSHRLACLKWFFQ